MDWAEQLELLCRTETETNVFSVALRPLRAARTIDHAQSSLPYCYTHSRTYVHIYIYIPVASAPVWQVMHLRDS
jgi:hypothetical protein